MTLEQHQLFIEGRDYWYQYLRLNDWRTEPNRPGLRKLSRNLDIHVQRLMRCIHIFLSA